MGHFMTFRDKKGQIFKSVMRHSVTFEDKTGQKRTFLFWSKNKK